MESVLNKDSDWIAWLSWETIIMLKWGTPVWEKKGL